MKREGYEVVCGETQNKAKSANYEALEPIGLQYFLRGMNDTYFVTTNKERYIFRVYRADRRTEEQVKFELEVLNYLQDNGIEVSTPIARNDGSYINTFVVPEGTKIGVMFTFAEGQEKPIRNLTDSLKFGKSVATIHKVTSEFKSHYSRTKLDLEYLIKQPLYVLQAYLSPVDYENLAKVAAWTRLRLGFVPWRSAREYECCLHCRWEIDSL